MNNRPRRTSRASQFTSQVAGRWDPMTNEELLAALDGATAEERAQIRGSILRRMPSADAVFVMAGGLDPFDWLKEQKS